jgi:hypothetical protein
VLPSPRSAAIARLCAALSCRREALTACAHAGEGVVHTLGVQRQLVRSDAVGDRADHRRGRAVDAPDEPGLLCCRWLGGLTELTPFSYRSRLSLARAASTMRQAYAQCTVCKRAPLRDRVCRRPSLATHQIHHRARQNHKSVTSHRFMWSSIARSSCSRFFSAPSSPVVASPHN